MLAEPIWMKQDGEQSQCSTPQVVVLDVPKRKPISKYRGTCQGSIGQKTVEFQDEDVSPHCQSYIHERGGYATSNNITGSPMEY